MIPLRLTFRFISILVLLAATLNAQQSLLGPWHGDIDLKVQKLSFEVVFKETDGKASGTISIPIQRAKDLPLESVVLDPEAVAFDLRAGPGLAKFRGAMKDGTITGSFQQGITGGTFPPPPGRLPKAVQGGSQLPYTRKSIRIPAGDHTLAGTVSTPRGEGPFPAVILVTGSGPQDRDAEVAGFPVFKTLADHLARSNMAVLAYDDRGCGESEGDFSQATTMMLADDAEAAWRALSQQERIDPKRVGILGHSEGGLIAPIVAARVPEVAFLILVAGPAVRGEAILKEQLQLILKAQGASAEVVASEAAMQARLLECCKTDSGWEVVQEDLRKVLKSSLQSLPAASKRAIGDLDVYAENQARAQIDQTRSPWFRQFVSLDPSEYLAAVRVPTLALFGGKDLQVPPAQSEAPLRQAMKDNAHLEVLTLKESNHLFQVARTGAPSEYARLEKAFDPEFVRTLREWVAKR